MQFTRSIPLTLYIHLPWCIRKCPYCDFNSHEAPATLPETLYIDALIRELDAALPAIWGRRLSAIFFGGGTPSLFSPAEIKRLLLAIHARLPFHADLEITLEANPGTVEQSRFEGFLEAGINRLSLGIQSFSAPHLKTLGRIHDHHEANKAITAARAAGFSNINIDLMHALPHQTTEEALSDLRQALSYVPTHISWYQLTIEPNTVFYRYPPPLPGEEWVCELQEQGVALLKQHGYERYEISAYATVENECRHNKNYWEFGDYLGIGAGAHSKLTDTHRQVITRHSTVKQPKQYLLASAENRIATEQILQPDEAIFEFMLNVGRLIQGFSLSLFEERTGLFRGALDKPLQQAMTKGLVTVQEGWVKPTELGVRFANETILLFLSG